MIWIILTASLFVLFSFFFTRWVRLEFNYDQNGLRTRFGYMGLSRELGFGESGEKQKKETPKEKDKEEKEESNAGKWLQIVPEVISPVKRLLRNLKKYGKVSELELSGDIGLGDPYLTGSIYGYIQGIAAIIRNIVPPARINLSPNFEKQKVEVRGRSRLEMRLASVLYVSIITLWSLPKRKIWRLIRSQLPHPKGWGT